MCPKGWACVGSVLTLVGLAVVDNAKLSSASGLEAKSGSVSKAERNKETVRRYYKELVNGANYSKAPEMVSPDFTVYFGAGWKADPNTGVAFFKASKESLKAFSKHDLVEDEMIAEGNTVAVRWHTLVIHDNGDYYGYKVMPNKKDLIWNGMSFYRFNDEGMMTEAYLVCEDIYELELRRQAARKEAKK